MMKKILLVFMFSLGFASSAIITAQTFTVAHDTVTTFVGGYANIHNNITNPSSSALPISWKVKATNFPADWLTPSAIGVCDACTCISNAGNLLWNSTTSTGSTYSCTYGASATNDFHLQLDLTSATSGGSHWLTVTLIETGAPPKDITFVINKVPVALPTVSNNSDMVIYPNPARDELNVVFDANADVANIAVYNIIGKVMTMYRVSGASANLNIENIPSGIYFVRLINSKGSIVHTKKFTKQ